MLCISELCAQLSDDFEDAATISQWEIFHSGDPVYYESLMVDDSLIQGNAINNTDGMLVMTCGHTYWYADVTGSYLYQMTWGDFTATTMVHAVDRNNTAIPPSREFNSAGLIIRNPDDTWGQDYIMTNLGMQSFANQVGSESKSTEGSISTLYLDPDLHEGEVRIERTGTIIRTYKRTGMDADFVLLDEFDRQDIPDTVQIGLVLNGYEPQADIRGEFEFIHFHGGNCRIVRNSLNDGVSSLREAISCAETSDTIRFDHVTLTDTINIDSDPLFFDKDLVLYNPSDIPVYIRSGQLPVIIEIAEEAEVVLVGIHIVNTDPTGQSVILNHGTLTLDDCELSGENLLESVIENNGSLSINGVCVVR